MDQITVFSPAKLNLYLRVIRRLPDGYHELVTLFQRISLGDTLRLAKRRQGLSLRCDVPGLSCGPDNLISRAYDLLKERFPHLGGVRIFLRKKIPIGAGLGGGSSNAAHFLLAMKKLYKLPISTPELMRLGRRLGADVPFFIRDIPTAIGLNRGDQIKPVKIKGTLWFLLVTDNKGLSTKKVYQKLRPPRPARSLTQTLHVVRMLCFFLSRKEAGRIAALMHNDLEGPSFELRARLKRRLERLAVVGRGAARMSGSGPTLFVVFPHQHEAKQRLRPVRDLVPSGNVIIAHSV
jgi:4-diphosphocytidyl-2-C-methyl-D-erythritol kinase